MFVHGPLDFKIDALVKTVRQTFEEAKLELFLQVVQQLRVEGGLPVKPARVRAPAAFCRQVRNILKLIVTRHHRYLGLRSLIEQRGGLTAHAVSRTELGRQRLLLFALQRVILLLLHFRPFFARLRLPVQRLVERKVRVDIPLIVLRRALPLLIEV